MSSKRPKDDSLTSFKKARGSKAVRGDVTVPVTASVNEVLKLVRAEKEAIRTSIPIDPSLVISQLIGVTEAEDLDPTEVSDRLEKLVVDIVNQILRSNTFELNIPNRGAGNQKYLEDLDRIVLGDKISKRLFLNTSHVRKTAITTRVIELVHEVLSKGIHITKRDLFYTDVKLFKDQGESDAVLDDVACMAGCTRTSLHVIASDKGLVVGRIQYREAGDLIDCTRMGIAGKAIPPILIALLTL